MLSRICTPIVFAKFQTTAEILFELQQPIQSVHLDLPQRASMSDLMHQKYLRNCSRQYMEEKKNRIMLLKCHLKKTTFRWLSLLAS
jgi:hypothetical protein